MNDEFLCNVFGLAAELGEIPVLFVGDLNVTREASHALSDAIASSQWHDVAEAFARIHSLPLEPTCFARTDGPGTRIDCILANTPALHALQSFRHVPDGGLPTHTALQINLQLDRFRSTALLIQRPLPLPVEE